MNADGSDVHMVSTGKGVTTCGYFLADNKHIIYASTHEAGASCPAPADRSKGYVWAVYPGFDIYLATDTGKIEKKLTTTPGYDAEGTVNWKTNQILYTSLASGDTDATMPCRASTFAACPGSAPRAVDKSVIRTSPTTNAAMKSVVIRMTCATCNKRAPQPD